MTCDGEEIGNGSLSWLFNQLALDYSGFFYLADDYELQTLSNNLSRKAGLVAGMADIGHASTWGMGYYRASGFAQQASGSLWRGSLNLTVSALFHSLSSKKAFTNPACG